MSDAVKVVSGHTEHLSDGREVPDGVYALGADLSDPRNKRLLDEGRIMKITAKEIKALPDGTEITPAPAAPDSEDNTKEKIT